MEGRCATIRAVVPVSTWRSAASTAASVCTSSADSGSSRIRKRGLPTTARASARRWRWPPDRLRPCSPTWVAVPCGSACTNSACATARARSSSSPPGASVPSSVPMRTFSATLAEKSVGSSKATETRARRVSRSSARMSVPSRVIRPEVSSCSRGTSAVSVVLPLPVAPTRAIDSPGRMCRSTRSSSGGEPGGASG
ncbi:hypothetical protein CF54_05230 [Streptomyces sp. Tu 6176]|nr:hypothetical protein CF54_05230 [Streptomyces sp. Tu 6176]